MATGEKAFSANFHLWNIEGLRVQFTVREDDPAKHMELLQLYLNTLNGDGWRTSEPDVNAKPKVEQIIGWLRGETKDGKPCVHLYTSHFTFKAYTVYEENLDELPINWRNAEVWRGAAPEKEDAIRRGVMGNGGFAIVAAPRFGHDGEPYRNDKGYVKYYYDRVVNATEAPGRAQSGPSTPITNGHANGTHNATGALTNELADIDVMSSEPIPWDAGENGSDNPFDGPKLMTPDERKKLHALGSIMFEDGWDKKRHEFVSHYGLESSNELNQVQYAEMMAYLEKQARIAIKRYANLFKPDELPSVDEQYGMELYDLVKKVKARM